ncbi:hypothetical protein [Cellulomonas sp. HD19AZ1]|uniref:hypothetical protein n=1 Tax=Cellulomonas sp. HD19AZ1 TaxID=2559593 RepID=UPI001070E128|nr:hypothetical protein [Cellulomonas sp. HD19AZ1]TFH71138.1 hypothetical protein E4A51_09790 [Cellulomonas sp. HD19AZ1]
MRTVESRTHRVLCAWCGLLKNDRELVGTGIVATMAGTPLEGTRRSELRESGARGRLTRRGRLAGCGPDEGVQPDGIGRRGRRDVARLVRTV